MRTAVIGDLKTGSLGRNRSRLQAEIEIRDGLTSDATNILIHSPLKSQSGGYTFEVQYTKFQYNSCNDDDDISQKTTQKQKINQTI